MASSNNLDALSQDAELPFGHPGRRFDDTPEGFEPSPLEVWRKIGQGYDKKAKPLLARQGLFLCTVVSQRL